MPKKFTAPALMAMAALILITLFHALAASILMSALPGQPGSIRASAMGRRRGRDGWKNTQTVASLDTVCRLTKRRLDNIMFVAR